MRFAWLIASLHMAVWAGQASFSQQSFGAAGRVAVGADAGARWKSEPVHLDLGLWFLGVRETSLQAVTHSFVLVQSVGNQLYINGLEKGEYTYAFMDVQGVVWISGHGVNTGETLEIPQPSVSGLYVFRLENARAQIQKLLLVRGR